MDTVRHPIFSRVLARLSQATLAETQSYRQEMLAGLSGCVIEVGAGSGINFAFFPLSVTKVVAVRAATRGPPSKKRDSSSSPAASSPISPVSCWPLWSPTSSGWLIVLVEVWWMQISDHRFRRVR